MRTLKFAILALIMRAPITGYDITREFNDNALSSFWYAKHSQVYPELKKLVDEGLIDYTVIIQGEKMEKKLYQMTSKGEFELKRWLLTDEPVPPTPKDIFRLRTYFSELIPDNDFITRIEYQLKMHKNKCAGLQKIMDQGHPSGHPAVGTAELGDYMVLEGALMREHAYIDWLNKCLDYMKGIEN